MKKGIHPEYRPVVYQDASTGYSFLTRSTIQTDRTVEWEDGNEYPLVSLEISSSSHPFYTGQQRLLDTAGRVERFEKKYGKKLKEQRDEAAAAAEESDMEIEDASEELSGGDASDSEEPTAEAAADASVEAADEGEADAEEEKAEEQ